VEKWRQKSGSGSASWRGNGNGNASASGGLAAEICEQKCGQSAACRLLVAHEAARNEQPQEATTRSSHRWKTNVPPIWAIYFCLYFCLCRFFLPARRSLRVPAGRLSTGRLARAKGCLIVRLIRLASAELFSWRARRAAAQIDCVRLETVSSRRPLRQADESAARRVTSLQARQCVL